MAVEILQAGALCTVQDLGRFGHRSVGVSTSGAMDTMALRIGNVLLNNNENCAAIEVPIFPFALRFQGAGRFAVTGAPCPVTLDGAPCPPHWAAHAAAGQVLRVDAPASGARAYVALGGGLDVPVILGSRSTYLRSGFGGHEGRSLRIGDVVGCLPHESVLPDGGWGAMPPPGWPDPGRVLDIRVMRAAEYGLFDAAARERFWTAEWRITPHSNRAGFRLSGPALLLPEPVELRSQAIVPGVVQVPPAGEPIIQMSDANTAGGYPKMAVVIPPDLWRLGQARLGSFIRFVDVDYAGALAAADADAGYLQSLRFLAGLHRHENLTTQCHGSIA